MLNVNKFSIFGTKVSYRIKGINRLYEPVFRGANHSVKAAKFVVANKREWDHYIISAFEG